jgi:hypothetical protein
MSRVQVFDPPMCCSTGVCGPSVDPALLNFAAALAWLQTQGVAVERFNLAQQPQVFAASESVRRELTEHGIGCLPLVLVDGITVSRGTYPSREQLGAWAGIAMTSSATLSVLNTGCCEGVHSGSGTTKSCC